MASNKAKDKRSKGSAPLRQVKVGCVQWQMRSFASLAAMLQKLEAQVSSLASYKCDFALFPEFFSAPLMGLKPGLDTLKAMHELARLTPELVEAISRLAVAYEINIIAGTMPVLEQKKLFNVAFLCRRDGSIETQYKLHPTPGEVRDWAMQGGATLTTFTTDAGRIGILVCYDVEFPELARVLAAQEMDILFVPSWTDSKHGYLRVRLCAQARAIEDECYVVLGSSVGMLPEVDSLDNQYGQSAVFSPADYGFPHDAIVGETTANTEMSLVVELDLDKLQRLRNEGSVRNGKDRRDDLYQVKWKGRTSTTKNQTTR